MKYKMRIPVKSTIKNDDFVKSPSAVLHFIPALLNCVRSSSTSEYEVGILNWKDEI